MAYDRSTVSYTAFLLTHHAVNHPVQYIITHSHTPRLVCVPNWGLSSNRGHYQPGSVPNWWVCIQTNVRVGRCLQTHIYQ